MTTVAELNAKRKRAGLPLIRFHIRRLEAQDIQDLRDAYAAMYEISNIAVGDKRGYAAIARGHGYDQDLCHTDSRIFLTWHRAYVYSFEKSLSAALKWKRSDPNLELTLPYWDWTQFDAATDAENGIPNAINDASYVDASGQTQENPLARAPSLYRQLSQGLSGDQTFTARYPSALRASIPSLADDVARYMDNPNFARFSDDFNGGAHGAVHVDVGGSDASSPLPRNAGDMTSVISAAYDPIFWLHHSMVDKVWFDWQTAHPNANVPSHVLDTVVYGGMVGRDLIDAEGSLQYVYFDGDVAAMVDMGGTVDEAEDEGGVGEAPAVATPAAATPAAAAPTKAVSEIDLGVIRGPFKRAQLDFHQLRPPKDSFEIRAFFNKPDANAETAKDDPAYAGRLVLFGHGICHGAPGHCNPRLNPRDDYDLRDKHPLRFEHTRYIMDITRGTRRLLAGGVTTKNSVKLNLVTVDASGKLVAVNSVKYRGVSLSTLV